MRNLICLILLVTGCVSQPIAEPSDASLPDLPDQAAAIICLGKHDAGADANLPVDCPLVRPATPDRFDEALTVAGLDRCRLGYTSKDWSVIPANMRDDPYRLSWYNGAHDFALRAPPLARSWIRGIDGALVSPTPVTDALLVMAEQLGVTIDPCIELPEISSEHPLASAVGKLITQTGGTPDWATLEKDTANVPDALQRELAKIVLALGDANSAWDVLAGGRQEELARVTGLLLNSSYGAPDLKNTAVAYLLTHFDEAALLEGAVRLAYVIETARLARFAGLWGFHFDQATPIGRVRISDAANDVYQDDGLGETLLLVDTGGDDRYLIPSGAVDSLRDPKSAQHVSVTIDCSGSDFYGYPEIPDPLDGKRLPSDGAGRYQPQLPPTHGDGPISFSETPRQGAARGGYGMLFDLGPEGDHYQSLRMSQGFGAAGVGVLFDAAGNDLYEGEAAVQGVGIFGAGLLIDGRGNDTYRTYAYSQGFGFVRGAGLLIDGAGDDFYYANPGDPDDDGDPLYFNVQLPGKANASFAQGAGLGLRAASDDDDESDAVYMSGGIGMLRDQAGDDRYLVGVYGQATGYWFGTGILADGAGQDQYDGFWYVQGAAAHCALAVFLDDAGNDKYNGNLKSVATSLGAGHDYAVAWHIDSGGDDVYHAPSSSLGTGYANGLGVFVNVGGTDIYHVTSEPTLGCGMLGEGEKEEARWSVPTTGIFVDVGGHDEYDVSSKITRGDGKTWIDIGRVDGGASEHGAGIDRIDGGVTFP